MKTITKHSLFLILFLLISCNDDSYKPDYSNGKATMLKNGESWDGEGRGSSDISGYGVQMTFDLSNNQGMLRQRLGFVKIPTEEGNYGLHHSFSQSADSIPGCSFTTIAYDGDVVEDRYKVVETGNESSITITNYDESQRLLSGEFRVKLFIDPDRPKANSNNPDTLLFEMGAFEVRIE